MAYEDAPIEDSPTVDTPTCRLLGPTALIVQGIMGVLVILSLVYKRTRESPRRPWRIWLFDVAKQIIGQMFVHGVNVAISDVLQRISEGNACIFYFLNILVDTTAGVGIIYLVLRFFTTTLTQRLGLSGFESGQYGNPPSSVFWAKQTAVYVLSITTMKLLVIGLFAAWPGIFRVGQWLLSWTGDGSNFQIIFVMGIFPIAMNILQFWLIDSIVKATHQPAVVLTSEEAQDADVREPLFRASEDEDDEGHGRPHDIESSHPRESLPPRTTSRTSSKPPHKDGDEHKSTASTPAASTSGTSSRADASFSMHAYPPAVSTPNHEDESSLTSARSNNSRRRSPPPPLMPRSPMQSAINSPSLIFSAKAAVGAPAEKRSRSLLSATNTKPAKVEEKSENDWNLSWGVDGDDWAERVGEEDWTGRRVEAVKGFVGTAWDTTLSPAPISVV